MIIKEIVEALNTHEEIERELNSNEAVNNMNF